MGPGIAPPRLVFWETTAACNLACAHCRRFDLSSEGDLTSEEARAFIEDLASHSSGTILVLSGGEPLVRPDVLDLAAHARDAGLAVSLATNGTLVDADLARGIAASGIRRVAVSLDGADPETHNALRRQPGSFEAALAGCRNLLRAGLELQVNCTVTRHNAHQLPEIHDLAVALRARALHFFLLVPVGCGASIGTSHQLEARRYEEILNWIHDRSQEGRIHMRPICAPHYFRILRQRSRAGGASALRAREGFEAMTKGCLAGTGIAFISHSGDLFPCGYLPLRAGNIRERRFRTLWEESPVLRELRDPDRLGGKCGECEFRRVCSGCRARAWSESGDVLAEEPLCLYEPGPATRLC
jgi:radical SAM protein with 4Fe4S-binding SPASM domain